MVPIPKVSNPKSVDEFRPLAILCTTGKLMERHVKSLLEQSAVDVVPPFQYAFEPKVGTTEAIQHLMHGVGKSMDFCKTGKRSKATNVSVVAMDIARAFDSVPHSVVVDTLSDQLGMPQYLTRWVQAFLTGRTQQVRVNDKLSTSIDVTASIVQGSSLGPTLFNLVVAGLKEVVLAPTTTLVQFADDVALVAPTQDTQQVDILQRDVNSVVTFFESVGLKTNGKKSQHLLVSVSPTGPRDTESLTVNGVAIQQVESLKYLGIHLDGRLSMKKHVDEVTRRARSMLHMVRGQLQRYNCRLAVHKIYISCIRPIMTYGLAAYYPSAAYLQNRLTRVDKTAAHIITNKFTQGIGDDLVRELQWPTIAQLAHVERVSHFWQYVNGIKRTPGGSDVIAKIPPPARSTRLRLRQDENVPKHSRYEIKGEHRYDATVRFNTPLAIAAHLYNMTPDTVFSGLWSAKRVKAALLAFERGESVDPTAGESVPSADN